MKTPGVGQLAYLDHCYVLTAQNHPLLPLTPSYRQTIHIFLMNEWVSEIPDLGLGLCSGNGLHMLPYVYVCTGGAS